MLSEREGQGKKPFETPKLSVYGDIRDITQAVGKVGNSDGGKGSMSKTGM
jgi:hypothetical protein